MLALLAGGAHAQRTVVAKSDTLRILQVSDTHHHAARICDDVPVTESACSAANTTAFLGSVVRIERPDLVGFPGNLVDHRSALSDVDAVVGAATGNHLLPWAAIVGNHDTEQPSLSGAAIPFSSPLAEPSSQGNFYIDVVTVASATVARLVLFSRTDRASAAWFASLEALPRVPTLAFLHIPLPEYKIAAAAALPMSGSMLEPVSVSQSQHLFSVLRAGGVVAAFCGHDHANDFCVRWQGVQLCYGGSAGFTAYGQCTAGACVSRRARVVELTFGTNASLSAVRSWKRVDGGGSVASDTRLDDEVLSSLAAADGQQQRLLAAGRARRSPSLDRFV
jgi:hypothetical protein